MKTKDRIKILAQAVYEAAEGKNENDLKKVVDNFSRYLKEHGLVSLLPKVLEELEEIHFEDMNIVGAQVVSRNELSKAELKDIISLIKNRTGKDVEIKEAIDEDTLGGVVVSYRDKLIDMSLKNQLNSLKKQLAN